MSLLFFFCYFIFYNKSTYSQLGTENVCGKNAYVKILQ